MVFTNLQAFFSFSQVFPWENIFPFVFWLCAYFCIFFTLDKNSVEIVCGWERAWVFRFKQKKHSLKTKNTENLLQMLCIWTAQMKFSQLVFFFFLTKNFKFISNFSHNHGHCFYHFTLENRQQQHTWKREEAIRDFSIVLNKRTVTAVIECDR